MPKAPLKTPHSGSKTSTNQKSGNTESAKKPVNKKNVVECKKVVEKSAKPTTNSSKHHHSAIKKH